MHPTVIRVAQCSERAPGPHGSSHRPSHVPTARCCLCMEHSGCCCVGRGREAAAGRCLQRETQREALHGGEGPRAAIHRCKTPWGAAAEWGKWDHRPIPTLQQRPWGPTMPPSPSGCPLPSLCGTWWLWGGVFTPAVGKGSPYFCRAEATQTRCTLFWEWWGSPCPIGHHLPLPLPPGHSSPCSPHGCS